MESEEVYTDDEDASESEDDEEESEEEWDEQTRKYVKKFAAPSSMTYRNYLPPVSIPFQYSGLGYAPMPASMATIPMFAKMAQAQQEPQKSAAPANGEVARGFDSSQID